jgi:hypothetical protein
MMSTLLIGNRNLAGFPLRYILPGKVGSKEVGLEEALQQFTNFQHGEYRAIGTD